MIVGYAQIAGAAVANASAAICPHPYLLPNVCNTSSFYPPAPKWNAKTIKQFEIW